MASIRPAAVAGMFYPGEPRALAAEIARFLGADDALAPRLTFPKALVVPHAGYVYSGAVAARAYQELAAARGIVRRVVLLTGCLAMGYRTGLRPEWQDILVRILRSKATVRSPWGGC